MIAGLAKKHGLPETNSSPLKWMVGRRSFPFGSNGLFSGAFAVSFREGSF